MSKSWLTRAMLAGLTGVGLASCTLISGVGDLEAVDSLDAALDRAAPNGDNDGNDGNGGNEASTPIDAGPLSDAPLLGDPDATIVDACSPSGCLPLPADFQLVAYGPATSGCPTGYSNPTTALTNPALAPNACTCQCTVTNPGNCAQTAPIAASYGDPTASITCPTEADTYSGGCAADGYMGPFAPTSTIAFFPTKAGPFLAAPCTPVAKPDTSKVGGTTVRVCSASVVPKCEDSVCAADPGDGYQACIASNGDVACPTGLVKHLVGNNPTFSCDGTSCKCGALQAQCKGTGKLELFAGASCSGPVGLTLVADGKCRVAPDAPQTWTSHRFTADPPGSPFCPPTGTATPSAVSLSQLLTVCCTK